MDSDFQGLYEYGGVPKQRVEQLEEEAGK